MTEQLDSMGGRERPDRWDFIETLRDGIYGVDPDGLCTFINLAALTRLGYASADELLGRHMHQCIHHTHADGSPFPAADCPLIGTLKSGRPVRLDNEVLWRKDGSSFVAEYSSFPLFGEDEVTVVGSFITFVEVSPEDEARVRAEIEDRWGSAERRRAEEALRASDAKFRTLADSISQLAWMTGPDGSIEWYNKRWYEYTGTTPDEMRGWGWKTVHHPDHVERVIEKIKQSFGEGVPWEDTFPLKRKDGSFRWFLSRAMPIRDVPDDKHPEGRILGWFGTNTDIDDLRQTEERLSAAIVAAEDANSAKSDFIANMSHELRTPLSAIIGYSEMMREEMADGADPAELAPDMQKVEANARHLLGLINDVLDLSKIESGKMEVFPETFEVAATLSQIASTVDALVARKNNALVLDLGEDLGTMYSDVTKLRQVLLNLLSNAAKFTENGTITLSAVRIANAGPEQWLSFRVSDTGIGMTQQQLGKLFTRFTQADASTTRKFGGTGLGLSISKAFSVMMGGDIAVESGPGQGTSFSVMLPAEFVPPSLEESGDEQGHAAGADGRQIVLVIDDDPAQRELMSRFLAREGFSARLAADGRTGIDLARVLKPKAILLDVMMPGFDGWSVLSTLKADATLQDIPVVMVTFAGDRSLAAALGAAEFVPKPVEWQRFKQVMDRFRENDGAVLVVDDDEDTRKRMRSTLERDGWVVVEAGNGQEALDCVARGRPAVVLLDLTMPVMDGYSFLRRFRELADCSEVPVVVLTNSDLSLDDRKRLRGTSQILNKGSTSLSALAQELSALADR